jgi:fermentation-respiration switch protein FrsA (DUF1100 family)
MIYYPSREQYESPADAGLKFTEVTLRTSDGTDISAWYVPAAGSIGTLLYCHGNAGNITHRVPLIKLYNSLKLDVLIFDYRGYGKSAGSPSEKGTYLDADAAWDYLVNDLKIRPEKIIIYGHSLGGGVAVETALKHRAGGLVIESGFKSVADLGREIFPFLPVGLIVRHKYASIDKVAHIDIPKLIIHSPSDEIIPFEHGKALFERASEPKKFLRIEGGHNEGALISGRIYTDALMNFIAENL